MQACPRYLAIHPFALAGTLCLVLATSGKASSWSSFPPAVDDTQASEKIARLPTPGLTAPTRSLALEDAAMGARDELEAMRVYNAAGELPVQSGITRRLPQLAIEAADVKRLEASQSWTASVEVDGAWRLRLRLEDVDLPAGAQLWVWSEDEGPWAFGAELLDSEGGIWTPSVGGESITLHLEWTGERQPRSRLTQLAQIFPGLDPFEALAEKAACPFVDAACISAAVFPGIEAARGAVAHIQYLKNGVVYACSGGLINDTDPSGFAPLFLTANHCISTGSSAASIEAFWDYHRASCSGAVPSLASRLRSNGSTVLATSSATDVTLLRFHSSVPVGANGRWYLGWDTNTLAEGTPLHRLSHPISDGVIHPQSYSRTRFRNSGANCTVLPRPRYIYSTLEAGATVGGSSGSPVTLGNGRIVGQLYGGCGPDPANSCNYLNQRVDGSLRESWPLLEPFINPQTGNTDPCAPGPATLCISKTGNDRRFEVRARFRSSTTNGAAGAVATSSLGLTRGGMFWFFNATNPEMLVKILDGCASNSRFWVFLAATTNVEFTVTIRDTKTGTLRTYFNPLNTAAVPVQDTTAFATCP